MKGRIPCLLPRMVTTEGDLTELGKAFRNTQIAAYIGEAEKAQEIIRELEEEIKEMSWGINVTGTRKAVINYLDTTAEEHVYGDKSQFNSAKEFIKEEVTNFPDSDYLMNGIVLAAYGHHDDNNRNIKIEINQCILLKE